MKATFKKGLTVIAAAAAVVSVVTAQPVSATTDAPVWEQRDDAKIYFYADPSYWKEFNTVDAFIYAHNGDELLPWGKKTGAMTDEGGNIWSIDLAEKGIQLSDDAQYGVIFSADWNVQMCELIIGTDCLGDLAYMFGDITKSPTDSNVSPDNAGWVNAERSFYAPPVRVSTVGGVTGAAYWADETAESLMADFLTKHLETAATVCGMTKRERAYITGEALGLDRAEVDEIAAENEVDLGDETPADAQQVAEGLITAYQNGDVTDAATAAAFLANTPYSGDEVLQAVYDGHLTGYADFAALSGLINGAVLKGDMDGDRRITVMDATLIQRIAAGYTEKY